jgi:hypothetical protein
MNAPQKPAQVSTGPTFPTGFGIGGPGPPPTAWLISDDTIDYNGGVTVGNPTGGPMGDGTLNAINLFIQGVDVQASLANNNSHFGNIDCGTY